MTCRALRVESTPLCRDWLVSPLAGQGLHRRVEGTIKVDITAMSEYQYYEFQAADRPLDDADKADLRHISSRAEISSTRFTNVYHYGDFRGDPRKLMERWFDLHLYVANWGTRNLMIRLPKRLVDRSVLDRCVSPVEEIELIESGENLIVEIGFNSEESGFHFPDTEGDGWLDSLAPLRNDALAGDLRLFYVLWLTAVQRDFVPDHVEEPLPGIGPLSAPLESLAEFFEVDRDLLRAAAESSTGTDMESSLADASRKAIESIPNKEKAALLLRLFNGDPHVAAEVRMRVRNVWATAAGQSNGKRRTVGELRRRGLAVREERRAQAARRREAERLRKAQEAERARRVRLDGLKRRGTRVWGDVEREIEYRNASSYDRAVALLVDLRSLAQETGKTDEFARRLESIRRRHDRKRAFIDRLNTHRLGLG